MSAADARVFVGLGSNLAEPITQIRRALATLAGDEQIQVLAISPLYGSLPWGDSAQPDYVNAVVELRSALAPHALLQRLLAIEQQQGRQRSGERRYAPRTLDLDLLAHGKSQLHDEVLTLPHPRLAERAFVLLPWADLAPDWELPGLGTVGSLLQPQFASLCWRLDG